MTTEQQQNSAARPPIVLLTDFGAQDWFVGVMRGEILRIDPRAVIVDLCHAIEPGNIEQAAWMLSHTQRHFPAGSIFCCVVDPGVGSERKALLAQAAGKIFIAPDNGLLSPLQHAAADWQCRELSNPEWRGPHWSNTFHGRDIFAPAAAHCSLGRRCAAAGPLCEQIAQLELPAPVWSGMNKVRIKIMHIDHFGNLIFNLRKADMELRGIEQAVECELNGVMLRGIHPSFYSVATGQPLFYWGSADYLELGVNRGHAARKFRLVIGDSIELTAGA